MRKCCDCNVQSPYFSDLSVPVIPGIWPSSPVFGPGIPWMFGLYSGCSRFCLQFKWALWPIKLEDEYLESSKQIWNLESPKSPWSGSRKGPLMVDQHGTVFGRFQVNPEGGYTQSTKLMQLYEGLNRDLS